MKWALRIWHLVIWCVVVVLSFAAIMMGSIVIMFYPLLWIEGEPVDMIAVLTKALAFVSAIHAIGIAEAVWKRLNHD